MGQLARNCQLTAEALQEDSKSVGADRSSQLGLPKSKRSSSAMILINYIKQIGSHYKGQLENKISAISLHHYRLLVLIAITFLLISLSLHLFAYFSLEAHTDVIIQVEEYTNEVGRKKGGTLMKRSGEQCQVDMNEALGSVPMLTRLIMVGLLILSLTLHQGRASLYNFALLQQKTVQNCFNLFPSFFESTILNSLKNIMFTCAKTSAFDLYPLHSTKINQKSLVDIQLWFSTPQKNFQPRWTYGSITFFIIKISNQQQTNQSIQGINRWIKTLQQSEKEYLYLENMLSMLFVYF